METIISSVIAAAVTLLVCIINNSQQAARTRNLLDYKLEQLTKRVDKHNNVIERTYELEKRTDIKEEQISPDNIFAVVSTYMNLWSARWLCYGQCWSRTPESDALWRIYSYDKMAVRIETTDELIHSQLRDSDTLAQYACTIDDVNYDLDEGDVLKTQVELLRNSKRVVEPFYHKRIAFQHENEKRVILTNKNKIVIDGLSAKGALFNFEKENAGKNLAIDDMLEKIDKEILKMQYPFGKEKLKTEMFIQISDLSQYISSVMVHPQADDWFVKLVEKICDRVGINCLGKSHMYDKLV